MVLAKMLVMVIGRLINSRFKSVQAEYVVGSVDAIRDA